LFELAEGGTLVLYEIGEMPVSVQSKLLGVLDEKKFRKVGGGKFTDVDVRIIAATNVDVETALKDKTFRSDLFYRLSIIPIHIPPLRDRKEDIPLLAEYFMARFSGKSSLVLSEEEKERLTAYSWPGNIRELSNIIERSVILRTEDVIRPSSLIRPPTHENGNHAAKQVARNFTTLRQMEEDHIREALVKVDGNYTRASKLLGISRSTLMRKLQSYSES
jgi:transcriptional regulator with PAS, ATPase and Fis domain